MAKTLATHNRSPRGFTLVELLVVIGIIALLAALVTPAVMQAQVAARNAAIKAEIDMLHMAIMNYKNEHGSFPPCDGFAISPTSASTKHLQRLFPRCASWTAQLTSILSGKSPEYVCPTNALTFWLSGFTNDPTAPLFNLPRQKLYDFDASRVNSSTGAYSPAGKSGSPYIYIDRSAYASFAYLTTSLTQVRAQRVPMTPPATNTAADFATASAADTNPPFANPESFQILSAGRDEVFGNDDDLSNFWPKTRKDYLNSLNQ